MAEPLKNMFNTQLLTDLGSALQQAYPAFDPTRLINEVCDEQWEGRELKQRLRHITLVIQRLLPTDYPEALAILRQASRHLQGYTFQALVFADFVEVFGLDYWAESMAAIEEFTQQSSGEMAIRPFIERDQARGMAQMLAWSTHPNHHVRRLSSEGCRPRLPWATPLRALKHDPTPILPILENLKNDSSEYVRRSVANNLNDITKDHPAIAIQLLQQWNTQPTPEITGITRHALRTLIKAGQAEALALIGYSNQAHIRLENLTITPASILMGEEITFTFEVVSESEAPQDLVIDYVLYFVKANGQQAPKVFKLAEKVLEPGQRLSFKRRHSFRPITTRTYYPGEHALALKINGNLYGQAVFNLVGGA